MKILVLTNLYPPHYLGGYELICHTVVDALRERGHEVRVLTSDHRMSSADGQTDAPGVERSLRINGFYGHPWRGGRALCCMEKHNNLTLRAAIERHRPDLVYVWNMGGLSKSMLLTLQKADVPTVYYLSDHWIARGLANDIWFRWWNRSDAPWPHRTVRRLCAITGIRARWNAWAPTGPVRRLRFRRIYFCSRALRELTVAAGYDVAHAAVIYVPVHERFFRGEPPPPRKAVERLLYVGRLAEDKGVMTALRALVLLRGTFDGRLTILGRGDPEYETALWRFADDQQLGVTFGAATAAKMPNIYREHDLLLFTSEWAEPFALTPIEAMASGLPVIGTTTGGSAELFRHGENALVYQAGDPEALADRICKFAADYSLRARCAAEGYIEAAQRYSTSVIIDQIEAYLETTVRSWNRSDALCPEHSRTA